MSELRAFLCNLGTLPDKPGALSTTRGFARSDLVTECAHFIDHCGLVDDIEGWERDDDPDIGTRGGRKRIVSHRALLVGMLVLGLEAADLSATELHLLLSTRLSAHDRDMLGLPARTFGYHATWRALRRVADLIDPVPGPRRNRPTWAMVKAFRERVTPQRQVERQQRANDLLNTLLFASTRLGADYLPDQIDLSVDATVYPIYGKRGHPTAKGRADDASMSPEFLAGWHAKTEDNRAGANVKGTFGSAEYTFGYDLHLGVIATGKGDRSIPRLFTSAVLNTPGMTPGRCAVEIGHRTQSLAAKFGKEIGFFIVDRGYSDQLMENFHRPLEAVGWTPAFDYKESHLGVTTSYGGMPFVAGSFYCPGTPEVLLTAHADRKAKTIDADTYQQRLTRLTKHRIRLKQTPKPADSSLVMECPAAGPNPVATCPHKQRTVDGKVLIEITKAPTGPNLPTVCANKRSVSVPVDKLPKGYQQLEYNSPQHREIYKPGRAQIEGENRILKDVSIRLADASQRRGRGFGLHCVIAAIKVTVANIREISRYLRGGLDRATPPPKKPRTGRPPATSYASYALPADQPTYIVGQKAPPKVA